MSMTTHQIEELRNLADAMKYVKANRVSKVMRDAAETISLLSAKVASQNMEKSTAYYNGGWIPVSERLPSEDGAYLTCHNGDGWIFVNNYRKGSKRFDFCGHNVAAWLPLPEPYNE